MRRTHDMGGVEAGEIDPSDHALEPWQKTTWAMRQVLGDDRRQLLRVDELRRAIEDLPAEQYESLGYFDRWIRAMRALLVEKGVLGESEIEDRIARLRAQRAKA